MAGNYEYKPKGIDIRVNKGKKKVDPNQTECDWAGCVSMGGCKAPKSPDRLREYYNFCTIHAREYNKNWNFFSNMSDEDIACLLYTSPSPRDQRGSRMPSSA